MWKPNPCLALISAAVLAGGVIFLSCARKEEKVPIPKQVVRLYTSVPVKIVEGIKLKFQKENPQIELEISRAGTGKTMKRIREEAETGNVGADVIWVADFSAAEALKEDRLLKQYISTEAENIIPIFTDRDGYYAGSRLLNMVVAYNTRLVKKKPEGYQDLLDPAWKGKVGIVNPEISGSSFFTVATLLQDKDFGWEYFAKLYQNECEVVANNPVLTEKIAGGELYLGITIGSTVRKLLKESPSLAIDRVFPEHGPEPHRCSTYPIAPHVAGFGPKIRGRSIAPPLPHTTPSARLRARGKAL